MEEFYLKEMCLPLESTKKKVLGLAMEKVNYFLDTGLKENRLFENLMVFRV